MTEAKSLATLTIEPVGADIYNPDTYLVRKRFQDTETTTSYTSSAGHTMFQDISDEFGTGATDVGCRIELKNGLYKVGQGTATASGANVEWSSTGEGDHVDFHIIGESREGVIIRNIKSGETDNWRMFLVRCNFDIENVTIDAADLSTHMSCLEAFGGFGILNVHNCHIMRHTGFGVRGGNDGVDYSNNIFDQPASGQDQCVFGGDMYSRVVDNYLDRTNGTYSGDGSSITAGGAKRAIISRNQIKRIDGLHSFAISIESFGNYDGVIISDNTIENGWINLDGSDTAYTMHRVKVTGNTIFQGGLRVLGPTTSKTGKVMYITIQNNLLVNSDIFGMKITDIGGRTVVKNNTIVNSNRSLTPHGSTIDIGLVRLSACIDLDFENNILEMNVTSPANADFSWYGIRYEDMTTSRIKKNHIINRTLANSSYVSIGVHTNCEISQDL